MTVKPNAVLMTSINSNLHSEEGLRKQRIMVVHAINAWSPGGYCHAEKMHIKGHCEEQKAYFDEALILIDKHLKKFRGSNNG